jgi:hypothetical protein
MKTIHKKTKVLFLGSMLASVLTANAAVLALYDFNGYTDLPITATTNIVSASTLTEGAGSTFNVATNNGQDAMRFVFNSASNTSQAAAVTANAYIEFTINPSSGFTLSNITWTEWSDFASTIRNFTFFVRTNADGYATTLSTITQQAVLYANRVNLSLDISSLGTVSSPLTTRLYYYDDSPSGGQSFIDDLAINGTAAVPEPSTYVSLTLGLCFLFTIRRLRRTV